jgi:hypothetical protein
MRKRIQAEQLTIKLIEENEQWEKLSSEVKEEMAGLVGQLFVNWIQQMNNIEEGGNNE